MRSELWQRAGELFHDALERDASQREAFLGEACGGDAGLRLEVERLLAHHDAAGDFLEPPDPVAAQEEHPGSVVGKHIGSYQLTRVIASGGMGTVYEALQDNPRRTVALKLMKQGLTSRSTLRRFEYEAQVLGRLRHPGIAQVFEAGTHDAGDETVPFFAMEFIRGVPLTQYAEENDLGTRRRLELFAKVCDAVHHGHQQGVIHRDLKPGNILVDRSGQPKVIDFGVARATDAEFDATTLRTDVGQLIGTLRYMSPEQVTGLSADLDVRSDVYSLGIVLYELLTGRLPYDLEQKSVPEAARVICEEEPAFASSVNSVFRGDVDTILRKALEKEIDRRYDAAAALAADLRHYLADEPISARPASTLYQLRKFSRRNRGLVTGLAIAFLSLVIGTVYATRWALEATDERNRAVAAEQVAQEQVEATRIEARKAERINQFLRDMLAAASPEESRGEAILVREILDRAAVRIGSELKGEPAVAASIRHTIGLTYQALGAYGKAESHLRAAVERRRAVLGDRDAETLQSMGALATVYRDRGKPSEAETLCRQTVDLARETLGDDAPETLSAVNLLALLLQDRGLGAESEPLYRDLLNRRKQMGGEEDPATLLAMNNMAWQFWSEGKLEEAGGLFGKALETRRRVSGEDHPETLRTMINLANVHRERGSLEEAEPLATAALASCRRVLGKRHAMTLYAADRLAWLYFVLGRLDNAEPLARETLALRREVLGEDHQHTFYSAHTLIVILTEKRDVAEAEKLALVNLESRRRVLGPQHTETLSSANSLGIVLSRQQKYGEALALLRETLAVYERVMGEDHPETLDVRHNIGLVLEGGRRLQEAEEVLRNARGRVFRTLGRESHEWIHCSHSLARVLVALGDGERAEPLLRELVEVAVRVLRDEDPLKAEVFRDLGRCLTGKGEYEEAERHLREAFERLERLDGIHPDRVKAVATRLAELYDAWGKRGEAAQWRETADAD